MVGAPLFCPLDGQTKGGVVVGTTTCHMAKDPFLISSLDSSLEKNILVVDDFALDIDGQGDVRLSTYFICQDLVQIRCLFPNLHRLGRLLNFGLTNFSLRI